MLAFVRLSRVLSYFLLFISILLSACSSIGPPLLPANRREYNSALQRSDKEQLLLNIVRMAYTDEPYFLGVASVNASMSFSSSLGGSWSWSSPNNNSASLSPNVSYSDSPTLSYSPLQGEQFTKEMLTPISLEKLFLLYRSGWSGARVMRITAQSMGHLQNAPSAARPSSSHIPEFKNFVEAVHLMRKLQLQNDLSVTGGTREDIASLEFTIHKRAKNAASVRRLQQLLKLSPSERHFAIVENGAAIKQKRSNVFVMQTRSVLGMLYYLSKGVDIADDEKRAGVVEFPVLKNGCYFDWLKVTEGMIHVHASDYEPLDATVAVVYRNRWYYIADNDTNSKETLSLMTQIFSLIAGNVEGPKPVLTLPI